MSPVEFTDASRLVLKPCRPELRRLMLAFTLSCDTGSILMFTPANMLTLVRRVYVVLMAFSL